MTGSIGDYRALSPGKTNGSISIETLSPTGKRCGSRQPFTDGILRGQFAAAIPSALPPSELWLAAHKFAPRYPSRVLGIRSVPHGSLCYFCQMDKRITRYNSLKAMKSDEYRSWQRLPGSERIRAVMDLNLELYAMKGQAADAPRLQRTVIRFQRRTS